MQMQISSPNCVAQRCDQQRGQLEEYKKKKKKKRKTTYQFNQIIMNGPGYYFRFRGPHAHRSQTECERAIIFFLGPTARCSRTQDLRFIACKWLSVVRFCVLWDFAPPNPRVLPSPLADI